MTYSIFHFLTTYKVEEKRDARDLGKGAAAGKEGERDSASFFLLSPRAFSASIFTIPAHRPVRLTQCCTQLKSPGVKILCVLYLHHNVAFTFK